ncbi:TIGR03086 family metal-binding protein [Actinokineospora sp.]|uniref:TIGR03086 family metal-binding protein n=1 Tax=Actinokineospora sp. TaxID=1872133 RepID=UPI003D6C4BB1
MSSGLIDLKPSADRVAALLPNVDDSTLDGPTPCAEYRVRELLGHLDGLSAAFRAAADKEFGPLTDTDPGESTPKLESGWRERLPERLDALVASWGKAGAWEDMNRAGNVDLPAEVMGIVALNEITLHGWDLAAATSQDYRCDDETAEILLGFVTQFTDEDRGTTFGPALPVPRDAPVFDRVLALSGRDPGWSRPGT